MSVILTRKQSGYSRMEKEDPEEKKHREAQFLIYKIMEQANSGSRRRPTCLRIRIRKFKLRIGRRLKKLRKSMSASLSTARIGICKQIGQLRTCKSLFGRGRKVETLAFPSLVS
ncbi:uncharacterized protein LOC111010796 [Momordica charantia]|uniref:Uncharacterized protein LOC111010796 n=1 Tax=Momordica charantia TaxID=3673 RepID=A0A6J1CEK3_MOMCH|nr:uncharacterized protein LOC111010796 [Momordica charantia]